MSNSPQPPNTGWTEARLARLVELWTDRLSAAQIARQLGDGLSRSAVVGKLFRMGLTRNSGERRDARADGARQTLRRRRPEPRALRPPEPFPEGPPCRVTPLMTDVMDLQPGSCRWPYPIEDEIRFCGHGRLKGRPYCAEHHRRAYDAVLPPLTREQIENIARRAS